MSRDSNTALVGIIYVCCVVKFLLLENFDILYLQPY